MNTRTLFFVAAFATTAMVSAQEPPGCASTTALHTLSQRKKSTKKVEPKEQPSSEISGRLPKRKVLDLRKIKRPHVIPQEPATEPVIAQIEPVYLPQGGAERTMIANGGFLYILVGNKLYKINEKTLKTVQTTFLERYPSASTPDSEVPTRKSASKSRRSKKE